MALDTVLADHCYCLSTQDPNLLDAENPASHEIRRSKRQRERSLPGIVITPIRHFDEYDSTKLAPCRIARWTSMFPLSRRRKNGKPTRKVLASKFPGTDGNSTNDANSPVKAPPKPPSAADAMKRLLHVRMNLIYKAQEETLRLWQLIQEENLEKLIKGGLVSENAASSDSQTNGANSQVDPRPEQANCLDADACNKRVKEIFDILDPLLSTVDGKPDDTAVKNTKHALPSVLQHMSSGAASMVQHNTTNVHQDSAASNVHRHDGSVSNMPRHDAPQCNNISSAPQAVSHCSGNLKKISEHEVKFQLRNPNTATLNNGLHLVKKDAPLDHIETECVVLRQVKGKSMDMHETEQNHCNDDRDKCDTMESSETEQLSESEFLPKQKKRKRKHKKISRAYVPGSRQFCVCHDFSIIYTTESPIW